MSLKFLITGTRFVPRDHKSCINFRLISLPYSILSAFNQKSFHRYNCASISAGCMQVEAFAHFINDINNCNSSSLLFQPPHGQKRNKIVSMVTFCFWFFVWRSSYFAFVCALIPVIVFVLILIFVFFFFFVSDFVFISPLPGGPGW